MLKFLLENGFYPQLFSPAGDDGGSGGGSGADGDGDNNDPGDGDKGGDDDGDKGLIDKDKILNSKDGDGDDDPKEGDKDPEKIVDRPEYVHEKFWDAEKGEPRVEAMAKAYKDLESKLGNNKKAPDEYKIDLDEDLKTIFQEDKVDSDPMLAWFKEYAKENNFSQEQFNDALKGFGKTAGDFLKGEGAPPAGPDPKEEKEALGKNADAIIGNQTKFLEGMFKRGEVNEKQMGEILILTETAAGIEALQAIRSHYGEKQNIPLNLSAGGGQKSHAELQAMMADSKYGQDPEYTSSVDKEYEKSFPNKNSGESMQSPL